MKGYRSMSYRSRVGSLTTTLLLAGISISLSAELPVSVVDDVSSLSSWEVVVPKGRFDGLPKVGLGGVLVDILILYTNDKAAAGLSHAQLETQYAQAISWLNQALAASLVPHRARLVGVEHIDYSQSNPSDCYATSLDDLVWLTSDSRVHALRDAYTADVVILGIEGSCGRAFIGPQDRLGFAVAGAVPDQNEILILHEFGHVAGLIHDPVASPSPGRNHGHGWLHPGLPIPFTGYHTIMAYTEICGFFCKRLLRFANPNLSQAGVPTGEWGVSEAAQVLTENMPVLSGFRTSAARLHGQYTVDPDLTRATTLWSLVNITSEPTLCTVTYMAENGTLAGSEVVNLGPHAVHSRNVRDVGLEGIGSFSVVCGDDSEVFGDWFVIDQSAAGASGDVLSSSQAPSHVCRRHFVRFFNGGLFGGGAVLSLSIIPDPGRDDVDIAISVYGEEEQIEPDLLWETSARAGRFDLVPGEIPGLTHEFGYLEIQITGGVAVGNNRLTAEPLFSVGFRTYCGE